MGKHLYRFSCCLKQLLKPIYPVKTYGIRKYEHKKSVFVMNHTSGWDPVVWSVWSKTRMHFMYKAEFNDNSFLRKVFDALEYIPVKRGEADISAIKQSIRLLESGEIVALFPEGTRNKERNKLKEFHTGAAMLAIKTQAPVRPFYVWDKYKAFHKNYIIVGEEFTLDQYYGKRITKEILAEATEIIRNKIEELRIKLDGILEAKGKKRRKLTKKEQKALDDYLACKDKGIAQGADEGSE